MLGRGLLKSQTAAGFLSITLLNFAIVHGGEPRALVGTLLDHGNQSSAKNLAAARDVYQQLRQTAAADDLRIDYAFCLVLMQQRRYDEALELNAKLLARSQGQTQLLMRRHRIWLLLHLQKHSDAVSEMELLVPSLKTNDGIAVDATALRETINFLGRVYGFLDGPIADVVTARALQSCNATIQKHLTASQYETFLAGLETTHREYAAAELRYQQAKAASEDERIEYIDAVRQEYAEQRTILLEQQQSLQARVAQQDRQRQRDIAEIDEKLADTQLRLSRFNGSLGPTQPANELIAIERELAEAGVFNPRLRNATSATAGRSPASSPEVAGLLAQLQLLTRERAAVLEKQQADSARFKARSAALTKETKRLDQQQDQVGSKVTPTEIRQAHARLIAIESYVAFPFKAEQARILATFDK